MSLLLLLIDTKTEIAKTSIGFGTVLAVVISWSQNKSIFWAILHGFFGWLYVLYYYVGRDEDPK